MSDWTRTEASDEVGANAWVIDEMRDLWAADPTSVDDSWRALFEGQAPGSPNAKTASPAAPAASRTTIDTTATDVTSPATATGVTARARRARPGRSALPRWIRPTTRP